MNAPYYPLWQLFMERDIVIERLNNRLASDAVTTQTAIGALLSKEGQREFKKLIERLTNG